MTDRAELEHRLVVQLHRWVSASGSMAHQYAAMRDIKASDFAALVYLWEAKMEQQSVTASQLAAHLNVTPAAVTYLVDRLAKRGYVERVPNPDDRRQVLLQVSPHGGQLGSNYLGPLSEWFSRSLSEHSDEDLTTFTTILADLTTAVSELVHEPIEPTESTDND